MDSERDCRSGGWPINTRLCERGKSSQAVGGHEVGVVDDGHEHLAGAVNAEGLLDEEALAVVVTAFELDLEGFAEDAQGVVVGVEGAVDGGRPRTE